MKKVLMLVSLMVIALFVVSCAPSETLSDEEVAAMSDAELEALASEEPVESGALAGHAFKAAVAKKKKVTPLDKLKVENELLKREKKELSEMQSKIMAPGEFMVSFEGFKIVLESRSFVDDLISREIGGVELYNRIRGELELRMPDIQGQLEQNWRSGIVGVLSGGGVRDPNSGVFVEDDCTPTEQCTTFCCGIDTSTGNCNKQCEACITICI